MAAKEQLTIKLRRVGKWYAATVNERPEVQTQGRTRAEALANVADALHQLELARKSLASGKVHA